MPTVHTEAILRRRSGDRVIAGVAGGIADHLGVPAWYLRAAFVVAAAAGGLGIVSYLGFWIIVPDGATSARASRMTAVEHAAAGVAALVALASSRWTSPFGGLFIPAVIGCVGGALIWRQAGPLQRARWRRLSWSSLAAGSDDEHGRIRIFIGIVLVITGCATALAPTNLAALRSGATAVAVTLAGVALIAGPWWLRMSSELAEERRERIRGEERAAFAAHLHDSVLQTLALIQSNAESPREVTRLARAQERSLRELLFSSGRDDSPSTLATALHDVVTEVECDYALTIEVVVVGDAPLDGRLIDFLAAVREALVNTARHADTDSASLYVEVADATATAYVRDRGSGFDPAGIPANRHGVRESIIERTHRLSGAATIRSEPGRGTEVTIEVPR